METTPNGATRYLIFIAGMGGLLYGVDVGIVTAALLYLGKTVSLTLGQTSAVVAAVFGGSMLSSLVAGFFADWLGRKFMMIVSGALFVASVALIVASHGFVTLLAGRILQGLSGGVIAGRRPLVSRRMSQRKTSGQGLGDLPVDADRGDRRGGVCGLLLHAAGGSWR